MNKLIIYPLLILFLIAGFSQLITISGFTESYESNATTVDVIANQTLNAEESELVQSVEMSSYYITLTTGIVVLIAGFIALAFIGTKVLGSGLGEHSVKIIWNLTAYYLVWAIFSALGLSAISSIPYFGFFSWLGLTLVYTLGVMNTTHEG